jgi:Ca2+-binding EF-hand superfamily protein
MRPLPTLTAAAFALALAAPAVAAPDGKRAGYDRSEPMARAEMMTKIEQRFAKLDTNADGTIDAAEMAAHREAMKAARAERLASMSEEDKAKRQAKMEQRRAAMKERKAERVAAGEAPRERRSKKGGWIARIDANGDGVISREEFTAPAIKRFDRLDANNDGIVTPEERAAGRRAARG